MPAERKLSAEAVRPLLAWAEQRRAIPTRKQIAVQLGISEPTVARIVRLGGYRARKAAPDIDDLIASIDTNKIVSRETIRNGSHQ